MAWRNWLKVMTILDQRGDKSQEEEKRMIEREDIYWGLRKEKKKERRYSLYNYQEVPTPRNVGGYPSFYLFSLDCSNEDYWIGWKGIDKVNTIYKYSIISFNGLLALCLVQCVWLIVVWCKLKDDCDFHGVRAVYFKR